MIFLDSKECKSQRLLLQLLDAKIFPSELLHDLSPDMESRILHPMSVYAAALSDDKKKLIAFASMTVTNERFYQRMRRGEAREEDFEVWDEKDTPLLFVRNLVVKDRRAAPYIFRTALKELHRLFVDYELYVHRVFTIASHWATRRWLKAYDFGEVGSYNGKYPILLASRDKSAVVNSYLKRYEA